MSGVRGTPLQLNSIAQTLATIYLVAKCYRQTGVCLAQSQSRSIVSGGVGGHKRHEDIFLSPKKRPEEGRFLECIFFG